MYKEPAHLQGPVGRFGAQIVVQLVGVVLVDDHLRGLHHPVI
jgi:hypothetical protein